MILTKVLTLAVFNLTIFNFVVNQAENILPF